MKKVAFLTLFLGTLPFVGMGAEKLQGVYITEVPFTQVRLNDVFWAPRIEVNRTVSIPSAFRECEKNGRFDNFLLAALNNGIDKVNYQLKDGKGYGSASEARESQKWSLVNGQRTQVKYWSIVATSRSMIPTLTRS